MIPPELTTPTRRLSVRRSLVAIIAISLVATGLTLAVPSLALTVRGQGGGDDSIFDLAQWRSLTPGEPLAGHVAFVDAELERMIVIGGEAAPFTPPDGPRQLALDGGGAWSTFASGGASPASTLTGRGILGARAIVDQAESAAYVLCHCEGASVHRLDLTTNTWSVASADTTKSFVHGLFAYDPDGDRALVFGGDPHDVGLVTNSAWALDLSTERSGWSELPETPFELIFQAAATDPGSGHFLSFGGQNELGEPTEQLWRLDVGSVDGDDAWLDVAALADAPWPPPRIGATLTFIEDTSQAILYGGYSSDHAELDDVWHLDYSTPDRAEWSLLDVPGAGPGTRAGHTAVWDAANNDLIVYGGARTDGSELRYVGLNTVLDIDPDDDPTPTSTATPTVHTSPPPPTSPTPFGGEHFIFMPLVLRSHAIE